MPIQKLILICIIFAATLLGSVLAADKPTAQVDIDKLQEQVRTLDKELAIQREAFVRKLDDVEKRQIEITAQQANSLAAIANQTTVLGNFIAYTSAAITVFVFIAGIATYFSAKSKAEKEARAASKKWFEENAEHLGNQIQTLRAEANKAASQIQTQAKQFAATATTLQNDMRAAATAVLNVSKTAIPGEAAKPADPQAVQVVAQASQSLKRKPESEFTANDFFTRGVSYFSNQDFHAALAAFDSAIQLSAADTSPDRPAQYLFAKGVTLGQLDKPEDAIAVYDELDKRFGADTTPAVREQVAKGLFNKGITLGQLDKPEDEIAVYDELDKRFGADTTPAMRAQVARGLNGAGFHRILLAKQMWQDAATRNEHLSVAAAGLQRALAQCGEHDQAMILGNLGYCLFLAGQHLAAEQPTLECLKLGGQDTLGAQRKDATLHRVEPEDSQYEVLLNRLWQSLPPKTVAS